MREKLEQIAALVATLPFSLSTINFDHGDAAACDQLLALGGERSVHVYRHQQETYAIIGVRVEVGGMEFRGQYERPPTIDELVALDGPSAHETKGYVAATVRPAA